MALERLLIRPLADVRELDPIGVDIAELSAIDYAGAVSLGGVSATSVNVGRPGFLTTILGSLQVDGITTLVDTVTAQGDVSLGDGGDTITLGSGTDTVILKDDLDVDAGVMIDLATAGGHISLPTEVQAPATDGTDGYLRLNVSGAPDVLEFLDIGVAWKTVAFFGGFTLDDAYNGGRSITADAGAVEITVPGASNNAGLIVNQNDTVNDPNAIEIANAGAGVSLSLQGATRLINSDGADLNISTTTAGDIKINSVAVLDLDAASVTLDLSGGSFLVTGDGVNFAMGISNAAVGVPALFLAGVGSKLIQTMDSDFKIDSLGMGVGPINISLELTASHTNVGSTGDANVNIAAYTLGSGTGIVNIEADDHIYIGNSAFYNADIYLGTVGARLLTIGNAVSTEIELNALLVDINVGVTGMTVDSVGAIAINSSAGTIGIGDNAVAQNINLGTNGARTIKIGSVNTIAMELESNGALTIDSFTSGISIDAHGVSNFSVDGSGLNLTVECFGGGAQKLILNSAGTGIDAIDLNAAAGGVALDALKASNFTVSGANADLTLGARGDTITLNELGDTSLDASFTAGSVIGALNELKNGPLWMNGTVVNIAAYTINVGDEYPILHVTRTSTGTCAITFSSAWIAIDYNTIMIKDTGRNSFTNNITITTQGAELFEGSALGGFMKSDGACWTIQAYNGNLYIID